MNGWPLRGDINGDGAVNMWDFALMAGEWLEDLPWLAEHANITIVSPVGGLVIPDVADVDEYAVPTASGNNF
jgi:hypothetical protein